MKRATRTVLCTTAFASVAALAAQAQAADSYQPHLATARPDLAAQLEARGAIPPGSTALETQAMLQDYLAKKLGNAEQNGNPLAAGLLKKAEKSGKPVSRHGKLRPNNKRYDNVVTLLVEFGGSDDHGAGPLHNELLPPAPWDNTSYWVSDFSAEHYQAMLFDLSPHARSMSTFYKEQSGGSYMIDGIVSAWVNVPHSEAYYGADDGTGIDNANGPVWRVVQDAAALACDVPWADFDTEDPYDLDGDGQLNEPDGYVDHIQLVHAGSGQEAGGGVQGDDAIWSHSWWANFGGHGPGYGGVQTCDPNVWIGPYTANPEDGTIGVFVHEFGHDLGLPDLYDTIYSGEASTGNWTLMSSGSWLGCPGEALGTCPSAMGAWEKWVLGWLDPVVVYPGEEQNNVLLRPATSAGPANKTIVVRLPDYEALTYVNQPYSGVSEWYSGAGDMLNQTLTREITLPANAMLSFWAWFDIELDWDYGFVEISDDGGASWATVAGNLTTNFDPNGNNAEGNGITGWSGGWVQGNFALSAYEGAVLLRFRYETDQAVQGPGWTIDDISVAGFSDDVENGNQNWIANGWEIFAGQATANVFHYYLAEWRTPDGFDVSMDNWYNSLGGGEVEHYAANPGMLLWYRDGGFSDNWVGVHPWQGTLLVVDSHPDLVTCDDWTWLANALLDPDPNEGFPFSTRTQIADATFGLNPVPAQMLTSCLGLPTQTELPASEGVATFDDSIKYVDFSWVPWLNAPGYFWIARDAIASVWTPSYGLKITVADSGPQGGRINVDFSGLVN